MLAKQGRNGRGPKSRCSSGKPLEMSACLFFFFFKNTPQTVLIQWKIIVQLWKDLSPLFGLWWLISADSVEKFGTVHLQCFSFSGSVSATHQSTLFLNLVCSLRAIYLYNEILDIEKMTEKAEAVFLPQWKENYNNMVLLESPAAVQSFYKCTTALPLF